MFLPETGFSNRERVCAHSRVCVCVYTPEHVEENRKPLKYLLPNPVVPEAVKMLQECLLLVNYFLVCLNPGPGGCLPLAWGLLASPWRRL